MNKIDTRMKLMCEQCSYTAKMRLHDRYLPVSNNW